MRLIDADALLEILRKDATEKLRLFDLKYEGYLTAMAKVEEIVEDVLPTIDPVKRGKWIGSDDFDEYYRCSECGKGETQFGGLYHYCPNCGARMEGEEDERPDK